MWRCGASDGSSAFDTSRTSQLVKVGESTNPHKTCLEVPFLLAASSDLA